jgi:hypothetical protein
MRLSAARTLRLLGTVPDSWEFAQSSRPYCPDQEIHVVLDNLSTHKPKRDRWRARHKNVHVHFHFTPTHTSWPNQVEIWFSVLARRTLKGASFTSVKHLRQPIDAFIVAYNPTATPFHWRKAKVHPKGLRYGSLTYSGFEPNGGFPSVWCLANH